MRHNQIGRKTFCLIAISRNIFTLSSQDAMSLDTSCQTGQISCQTTGGCRATIEGDKILSDRKTAKAKGAPWYIGAMCKHGHSSRRRYTSTGECIMCRQDRTSNRQIAREEMTGAELAAIRTKEREAKRAQRARARALVETSPWSQIIRNAIQHYID